MAYSGRLQGRYPSFTGLGRPGSACQSLKLGSHKRSITETVGSFSKGRKECRGTWGVTVGSDWRLFAVRFGGFS